jgi:cysteine desulfurase/selenocysteine lyase
MSTSEPQTLLLGADQLRGSTPELPGREASAHDGLSPDVVARIANELFMGFPDSLSIPAPPDSGPPAVPATVPAFQPEIQLPSDQHFPTLPASASPAHVSPVSAPYQAALPAVPGALATATEEAQRPPVEFSFLQEARPITAGTLPLSPALPASALPFGSIHGSEIFGTLPIDEVESRTAAKPQPSSVPTPTDSLPASVPTGYTPMPTFSFLEERRPFFSDLPSASAPKGASSELEPKALPSFELELTDDFLRSTELAELVERGSYGFLDGARPLDHAASNGSAALVGIEQDVPRNLDLTAYPFDAETIKRDFPILRERVNGRPLVWLDNAATTQKPQSVIDRLAYFYEHENSNVHRAAHELAARATDAYEAARDKVRRFVNASSTDEIIFVRGATEGINLIAQSWGRRNIRKDDEIVITWLEHHANIVPWQMLCSETGAKLRIAPVDDSGQVLLDEYEKLLGPRTRLVSLRRFRMRWVW